jgi:hypothetical protein
MFVVAAIQTALFLGGWNDPFGLIGWLHHTLLTAPGGPNGWGLLALNLAAGTIFLAKCAILIYVQMWVRWTLPRPRIDQVLYACVKVLLPMACVLLLGAAIWQLLVSDRPGVPWRDYHPYDWQSWSETLGTLLTQSVLATAGALFFGVILGYIAWAFASGRNNKQRLTEPAPIVTDGDSAAEVAPA